VVHHMLHRLAKRVFPPLALKVLIRNRSAEAVLGQAAEETLSVTFHLGPARPDRGNVRNLASGGHLLGRGTPPALQPYPLGPQRGHERAPQGPVTGAQFAGERLHARPRCQRTLGRLGQSRLRGGRLARRAHDTCPPSDQLPSHQAAEPRVPAARAARAG
jgi:hypothetical protein